ncbi:MAG: hypothetical protein BWY76_01741 [bacterium ADurb.Bin429]|nr:MAG: hypothetical protein BWY76_01741 [bacterium ADurb.Bin429]
MVGILARHSALHAVLLPEQPLHLQHLLRRGAVGRAQVGRFLDRVQLRQFRVRVALDRLDADAVGVKRVVPRLRGGSIAVKGHQPGLWQLNIAQVVILVLAPLAEDTGIFRRVRITGGDIGGAGDANAFMPDNVHHELLRGRRLFLVGPFQADAAAVFARIQPQRPPDADLVAAVVRLPPLHHAQVGIGIGYRMVADVGGTSVEQHVFRVFRLRRHVALHRVVVSGYRCVVHHQFGGVGRLGVGRRRRRLLELAFQLPDEHGPVARVRHGDSQRVAVALRRQRGLVGRYFRPHQHGAHHARPPRLRRVAYLHRIAPRRRRGLLVGRKRKVEVVQPIEFIQRIFHGWGRGAGRLGRGRGRAINAVGGGGRHQMQHDELARGRHHPFLYERLPLDLLARHHETRFRLLHQRQPTVPEHARPSGEKRAPIVAAGQRLMCAVIRMPTGDEAINEEVQATLRHRLIAGQPAAQVPDAVVIAAHTLNLFGVFQLVLRVMPPTGIALLRVAQRADCLLHVESAAGHRLADFVLAPVLKVEPVAEIVSEPQFGMRGGHPLFQPAHVARRHLVIAGDVVVPVEAHGIPAILLVTGKNLVDAVIERWELAQVNTQCVPRQAAGFRLQPFGAPGGVVPIVKVLDVVAAFQRAVQIRVEPLRMPARHLPAFRSGGVL